jgi:hypothetical protein
MIFCNQCGSPTEDSAGLCPECGAQILRPPGQVITEGPVPVVNPASTQRIVPTPPPSATAHAQASAPPQRAPSIPFIITATALATALLVVLGAVGASFWMKNGKAEVGQKAMAATDTNKAETIVETRPAPAARSTPAVVTPSPSFNSLELVQEVRAVLHGWAATSRSHDLNAHMSYYAPTLDTYYRLNNVSAERVRADRARAYDRYYKLDVQLGDIDVTLDTTGERATAVFDKSFNFEGDKYLSGKVREMVWLARFGRRWLITGEKDIQVYYVNR